MELFGIHNITLGIILCLALYNGVLFISTAAYPFLFTALMTFSFSLLQFLLAAPFVGGRGIFHSEPLMPLALLIVSLLFMSSMVHFTLSYFTLPGSKIYLLFYLSLIFILLLFELFSVPGGNSLRLRININTFTLLVQSVFIVLGTVLIFTIIKGSTLNTLNRQIVFFSLVLIIFLLIISLFSFSGPSGLPDAFNSTFYAIPFLLLSLALVTEKNGLPGSWVPVSPAGNRRPVNTKKAEIPKAYSQIKTAGPGTKPAARAKKEPENVSILNLSSLLETEIAGFNRKSAHRDCYIIGNIREELYIKANKTSITKIISNLLDLVKMGKNRGILLNLLPKQEKIELTMGEIKAALKDYQQKIAETARLLEPLQGKIYIGKNKYTGHKLSVRLQLKRIFKNASPDPQRTGEKNAARDTIFILDNSGSFNTLYEELHKNYKINYCTSKDEGIECLRTLNENPRLVIVGLKNEIDMQDFIYELSGKTSPFPDVPLLLLTRTKPFFYEEIKRGRSAGFAYLLKPLDINKVHAVVGKMVTNEKRRLEKNLQVIQNKLETAVGTASQDNSGFNDKMKERCSLLGLTDEEIKVTGLLLEGLDLKEIARTTAKPEPHITNLTGSIYEKCNVTTRIDLINLMFR